MPILSSNAGSWRLVSTTVKNRLSLESRVVNLGNKFTSPYLIVRVSSTGQHATWTYGGKLWASFLTLGKQAKYYQVDLELFEQELVSVPLLFKGKYSLLYQAPKWFPDVTLKVWEYQGEIIGDTETIDLTAIEDKLSIIENNQTDLGASLNSFSLATNEQLAALNFDFSQNVTQVVSQINQNLNSLSSSLNENLFNGNLDVVNEQIFIEEEFL